MLYTEMEFEIAMKIFDMYHFTSPSLRNLFLWTQYKRRESKVYPSLRASINFRGYPLIHLINRHVNNSLGETCQSAVNSVIFFNLKYVSCTYLVSLKTF